MSDRIVVLIDMDCFYCQVETRLNPALEGKPLAVVQYNQWQGGGIIAVNYEARAFGVTRHLRGNEAKQKCPDIVLVSVPSVREKADISKYRDAGREVAEVFCQFSDCVERASIDEAYLDITKAVEERISLMKKEKITPEQLPNTFVVGFSDLESNDEDNRLEGLSTWLFALREAELRDLFEEKLAVGGIIVEEMRAAVFAQTGFRCSAGISHNKILAKLACGLHKPNRQTILPHSSLADLYQTLPIKKVRSLGGKFGEHVSKALGCSVMGDLAKFTLSALQEQFDEKHGTWLYNIARGIDLEPVTPRLMSKSIGCCKKFPGKQALSTKNDVKRWLHLLAAEVMERLMIDHAQNKRRAKTITVSYRQKSNPNSISSRCGPLSSYDVDNMAKDAYELLKCSNSSSAEEKWEPALTFLGISTGKFISEDKMQKKTISSFFTSSCKKQSKELDENTQSDNLVENKYLKSEPSTSFLDCKQTDIKTPPKSNAHNSRDGESFFKSYFKKKHEGKSKSHHERLHIVSTNSDSLAETLSPNDKVQKERELSVSIEQAKISESDLSSAPDATLNHINSEEREQWISPHELFPNLDEADEETVALLPSPMQRKIRKSAKMESTVSNSHKKITTGTSSSDPDYQDLSSSPIIGSSAVKHVPGGAPLLLKSGESNKDYVNYEHKNNYSKRSELEDMEKTTFLPGDTQKSNRTTIHFEQQNAFVGNDNLISPISAVSDIRPESTDILQSDELSEQIASEMCPHCKNVVLLSEYPEHLDFHLAEELQKELNNVAGQTSTSLVPQATKNKVNVTKRKKGCNTKHNTESKADNKKLKSITSFFAPLR